MARSEAVEDEAVVKKILAHIDALNSRYNLYRSLVFRGITWRYSDNEHLNVVSLVHMSDQSTVEALQVRPLSDPRLCRVTLRTEPGAVSTLLTRMARDHEYSFGTGEGISTRATRFNLRTGVDSAPPKFGDAKLLSSDGGEWPYRSIHGGVMYFLDTHNQLEHFQPSAASVKEAGFQNFQQLFRDFLFAPFGEVYAGSLPSATTGVYVFLPSLHGRLPSVEIAGNVVRARVEPAEGVGLGDFKFVVYAQARTPGRYYRMQDYQRGWDSLSESNVSHEFPLPPQYAIGRLFWNPGRNDAERFVDERYGNRADLVLTPQLAVWQSADPQLRVLRNALETADKQMTFEWGVASTLSLAGFQVNWLGFRESKKPQIGAGVDVVAIDRENQRALIGESTLKPGDISKKISGVSEHSAALQEVLTGWQVKKAVFTTITSAGLVPYEQPARDAEVVLVSSEALDKFVQAVMSGVPLSQLWDGFRVDLHKNPSFG